MDKESGRIVIGLPQPVGITSTEPKVVYAAQPFVEEVQRVKDFDSFRSFGEKYGTSIIYRRPDGSVNPVIQRWLLTGNPEADLSRELLKAINEGKIGVRASATIPESGKPSVRVHMFAGEKTGVVGSEGEGIDKDLVLSIHEKGLRLLARSLNRMPERKVSLDAVWEDDKKQLRVLKTIPESGLVEWQIAGPDGPYVSVQDLRPGPELTQRQLMAVWREEEKRFIVLRSDIESVLPLEVGTEEASFGYVKKDKERLARFALTTMKHFEGVKVGLFFDEVNPSLKLDTPTLESATFMAIFLKLTGGLDYVRCKRKACSIFFWTKDPRKEYCCRDCMKEKHKEEPSPMVKERRRLNAIVDRREDRWRKTKEGIEPATAMTIRAQLTAAESLDKMSSIEKKYHLERERPGRRAKADASK